jgi:hypothetical protein
MSNLDRTPSLTHCGRTDVATRPVHERFGTVREAGERLSAPPLPPGTLKPGGATR